LFEESIVKEPFYSNRFVAVALTIMNSFLWGARLDVTTRLWISVAGIHFLQKNYESTPSAEAGSFCIAGPPGTTVPGFHISPLRCLWGISAHRCCWLPISRDHYLKFTLLFSVAAGKA
jgi:hypothetical protein